AAGTVTGTVRTTTAPGTVTVRVTGTVLTVVLVDVRDTVAVTVAVRDTTGPGTTCVDTGENTVYAVAAIPHPTAAAPATAARPHAHRGTRRRAPPCVTTADASFPR